MKRKIALLIALLAASAIMLTACGENEENNKTIQIITATQSTAKEAQSKDGASSKSDSSSKADSSSDSKAKNDSSSAAANGGSADNGAVNIQQDGEQSAEIKDGEGQQSQQSQQAQQSQQGKSGSDSSKTSSSSGESSNIDITLDEYELPIIFE